MNEYWVITASHCIFDGDVTVSDKFKNDSDLINSAILIVIKVVAGLHRQSEEGSNTQRIPVVEKITHPNYPGANGIANDVALLRLGSPLQLDGAYVNFACMPEQGQAPPVGQVIRKLCSFDLRKFKIRGSRLILTPKYFSLTFVGIIVIFFKFFLARLSTFQTLFKKLLGSENESKFVRRPNSTFPTSCMYPTNFSDYLRKK